MDSIDISKILEAVAILHETTVPKVIAGIEEVIDDGWKNPDPAIHAKWSAMSPTGIKPTVEEVILYLSALIATEVQMERECPENPLWYLRQ